MIVVANRVTSSTSSSSQIKQEHVKDENDNSSRNSNNEDFFDDWKLGNWCWERDYNKYPVVVVSLHTANNNNNNNNCHDNGIGINDRSNDAKMNTTEHYEQCDDERKLCGSDIDERKPAAITYASTDSGRVTNTTSATMEIATATKKDAREISISKNPQIKTENNDEKNTTNDSNDFNNNKYNENYNDDDDDDDSFYDDWVEGNWCLLDNSDNSNGEVEGKGDDDNAPRKMHHEVTIPSETTKMTVQKKS